MRGLIRRRELAARADEVFARLGIERHRPVRAAGGALARAAADDRDRPRAPAAIPQILFLDEPTSALAEQEVEWLFGARARPARRSGKCVIFTSHRWGEVANLADRITVFRNGEHVATRDRLTERPRR